MKLILAVLVLGLVVEAQAQWYRDGNGMLRAYRDMRRARWRESDARGNYDAARHDRWAARVMISKRREALQGPSHHGNSDSAADQEANRWGRNGGDPNPYRPRGENY